MKLLIKNWRKFLTENEEDAMLEKLLKLEPEQALALVDALKGGLPNIEKLYLKTKFDGLLDKVYKLQHQQGYSYSKRIEKQLQKAHNELDIVEKAYEDYKERS